MTESMDNKEKYPPIRILGWDGPDFDVPEDVLPVFYAKLTQVHPGWRELPEAKQTKLIGKTLEAMVLQYIERVGRGELPPPGSNGTQYRI